MYTDLAKASEGVRRWRHEARVLGAQQGRPNILPYNHLDKVPLRETAGKVAGGLQSVGDAVTNVTEYMRSPSALVMGDKVVQATGNAAQTAGKVADAAQTARATLRDPVVARNVGKRVAAGAATAAAGTAATAGVKHVISRRAAKRAAAEQAARAAARNKVLGGLAIGAGALAAGKTLRRSRNR